MAGIEPASERIDPRTSTSVVALCFRSEAGELQTGSELSAQARGPSFAPFAARGAAPLALWRPLHHRPGSGVGGRDLTWRSLR